MKATRLRFLIVLSALLAFPFAGAALAASSDVVHNIIAAFDIAPSTPIGTPAGTLNSTSGYTLNPRPVIAFWSVDVNTQYIADAQVDFALNNTFSSGLTSFQYSNSAVGWSPSLPAASGTTIYYTPQSDRPIGTQYVRFRTRETTPSMWSEWTSRQIDIRTPSWTDTPISTGSTRIKAAHVNELRSVVSQLLKFRGFDLPTWSDSTISTGSTRIKPVHFQELRTQIDRALTSSGKTPGTWTDSTLSSGTTLIRVIHLEQLRRRAELP